VVTDPTPTTDAWADIHVFDAVDDLIQAGTAALQRRESTPNGAVFVWDDDVYQGSGGGSGVGVWARPDAHTIQYRLYCQRTKHSPSAVDEIFTDGILHEFELPADEDAPHSHEDR
jgi:hypothetical protein